MALLSSSLQLAAPRRSSSIGALILEAIGACHPGPPCCAGGAAAAPCCSACGGYATLAAECLAADPALRPAMSVVIARLEALADHPLAAATGLFATA